MVRLVAILALLFSLLGNGRMQLRQDLSGCDGSALARRIETENAVSTDRLEIIGISRNYCVAARSCCSAAVSLSTLHLYTGTWARAPDLA